MALAAYNRALKLSGPGLWDLFSGPSLWDLFSSAMSNHSAHELAVLLLTSPMLTINLSN
jgi:hypothetical protein